MRILGIDPSLNCTGYGIVDCERGVMRLVEFGVIAPSRSRTFSQRLAQLQHSLTEVIVIFKPDVMVVEEVFSKTAYPRAAIMMAHARGALVCAAAMSNLPIFDYSATAVKRALVGNGGASKQQVAAMVAQALRLHSSRTDITDALALAIAHARRTNGRSSSAHATFSRGDDQINSAAPKLKSR